MRPGEVGVDVSEFSGLPNLSRLYRGYDDEAEPTTSELTVAQPIVTSLDCARDPHIRTTMQLMPVEVAAVLAAAESCDFVDEHTTPTGGR